MIDLYVKKKYSLNQLQSLVQSDKRSIRDYLLANDIEVSGISDKTLKYLYEDATIYLDRKYEKYKDYCRLYEESYRLSETQNGGS